MAKDNSPRKEEILDAAIGLFARFGYKKTSLADIADLIGITPAALFRYFEDKRALYEAAAARGLLRWQEAAFSAAQEETNPLAALVVLSHASFDYLSRDPEFAAMLKNDPGIFPLFSGDSFETINDASKAMIHRLLSEGQAAGLLRPVDIDRVSHLFFSVYKMFIVGSYIETRTTSGREVFDQFVDIAIRGVLTDKGMEVYRSLKGQSRVSC